MPTSNVQESILNKLAKRKLVLAVPTNQLVRLELYKSTLPLKSSMKSLRMSNIKYLYCRAKEELEKVQ